ncbi:excinuclease ABC subunit A [Candidatus Woesebacteria bacterium RBG_19FT_COMBO_42_9]|uniref:UvrABC system protein A n=1 Tax=Candidatus Woesebacteria bacterium RBG_16_42_24 TaxID=1802485 RepID=A0A1F7XKC5_9BACT|nr:MAG: excinuclease ABC subunit A [Candidatus Woesebacteria bacterium RBG_16_42_24]OGM17596.1 MAG: excinuclease ABC subunit A [Candidatus Woesebacteria bacterium RBG_19FT_COMBO_42_9]OGM67105.1 MAG: excinuclease ABC subunit A [Candidatus Woesebacteria bacterium RIFCSPLOWO2_01_FULL_43_11]
MENVIKIRGARQHNLKNIDLEIPKNKLVVFTGVSGSGKSSLAFDTIYAEGQRRYVESLSTYARQFLGIMEKPDVDHIEGLSPAISIDQKTTSRNPRSTVGTVTEVYDYLRLLFARVGHPHCPICGREISHQTLDQIVEKGVELIKETAKKGKKAWFLVLSPIVIDRKGEFSSLFDNLKAKGYKKVRVDGYIKDLSEELILIKTNKHSIEAVIDRISLTSSNLKDKIFEDNLKSRLADSIQQALNLSEGNVILAQVQDSGFEMPDFPKKFSDHLFSEKFACPVDNIQIPEIEPRTFSFNSPHGACPNCSGIGKILKVDPNLVFSDVLSVTEGGILPLGATFEHDTWFSRLILKVCQEHGIDARKPTGELTKDQKEIILTGTGFEEYKVEGTNRFGRLTYIWERFEGIVNFLERRHRETDSDYVRWEIEKYMRQKVCEVCKGTRLKKESLSITIDSLSIAEVTSFSIDKAAAWVTTILRSNVVLNPREKEIGKLVIREIESRLNFLISVGLEYITIDREAGTLSGGEAQRIRLASQIGSGLSGVLYVLDEPTIGLHQRDNQRLIDTLKKLRDLGNTVIVVEHDREMINQSDHVIDFGPGAGKWGGQIVASGSPKTISNYSKSLTGQYLSEKKKVGVAISNSQISISKTNSNHKLQIFGCQQFNLKDINVEFPLGKFIVITGVSGSGKSTLLVETLYPALYQRLNPYFRGNIGTYRRLEGEHLIDKVILIDQSPIGRTPRSNPATYTKVFDPIRDVFAASHESKARGFKKGHFSFNVRGGRCEGCEGQGQIKIEMQFMSDIWVTCEVCHGKRYNSQTLEIAYKGKNIAEVLEMTVTESLEFFHAHPQILSKLETIKSVGLGYMHLGQPATTLSGGEAQRVKLATELSKKATGRTFYILDEPTTGLHFADVENLLKVLKVLVSRGNTVCVIEHNLDVIKNADWIIDLGPEGGEDGGRIIARGGVQEIKQMKTSYTGQYLK